MEEVFAFGILSLMAIPMGVALKFFFDYQKKDLEIEQLRLNHVRQTLAFEQQIASLMEDLNKREKFIDKKLKAQIEEDALQWEMQKPFANMADWVIKQLRILQK